MEATDGCFPSLVGEKTRIGFGDMNDESLSIHLHQTLLQKGVRTVRRIQDLPLSERASWVYASIPICMNPVNRPVWVRRG